MITGKSNFKVKNISFCLTTFKEKNPEDEYGSQKDDVDVIHIRKQSSALFHNPEYMQPIQNALQRNVE